MPKKLSDNQIKQRIDRGERILNKDEKKLLDSFKKNEYYTSKIAIYQNKVEKYQMRMYDNTQKINKIKNKTIDKRDKIDKLKNKYISMLKKS